MSLRPRKVSRNAAFNPVGQAVARAALAKEVLNAKVRMLLSDETTIQTHDVQGIARYLTLAITAARIEGTFEPEVLELDSVLLALTKASDNGFRVPREEVVDICDAIDLASEVLSKVSKVAIRDADRAILEMERKP